MCRLCRATPRAHLRRPSMFRSVALNIMQESPMSTMSEFTQGRVTGSNQDNSSKMLHGQLSLGPDLGISIPRRHPGGAAGTQRPPKRLTSPATGTRTLSSSFWAVSLDGRKTRSRDRARQRYAKETADKVSHCTEPLNTDSATVIDKGYHLYGTSTSPSKFVRMSGRSSACWVNAQSPMLHSP